MVDDVRRLLASILIRWTNFTWTDPLHISVRSVFTSTFWYEGERTSSGCPLSSIKSGFSAVKTVLLPWLGNCCGTMTAGPYTCPNCIFYVVVASNAHRYPALLRLCFGRASNGGSVHVLLLIAHSLSYPFGFSRVVQFFQSLIPKYHDQVFNHCLYFLVLRIQVQGAMRIAINSNL